MNLTGKTALILGALANFAIALLHLIIIFIGAPGYRYFGAPDLAVMDAAGSPLPALITFGLTLIFFGFGLYALSGAGRLRRLPLLRLGLIFVGGVYTLRGLIVVLDLLGLMFEAGYPFRQTVFSATALVIGLLYLVGVAREWESLRAAASHGKDQPS